MAILSSPLTIDPDWLTTEVVSLAHPMDDDFRFEKMSELAVHKTVKVNGLDVFYREAGPKDAPAILLLHGFPTSSHMFRNLIPALADRYHLVAPDYPGFGYSSAPPIGEFEHTFDNLAKVIDAFAEKLGRLSAGSC